MCRRVADGGRPVRHSNAGAVFRLPDGHRQQARALGQDCRVHAPDRRRVRPRPLPRARKVDEQQSVHRARNQRSGHAQEPGSLQAARAKALFPGRSTDRSRARRNLPAGQGCPPRHDDDSCDGNRRVADDRRAGAPARDRQFAAGEEDPRQRDLRPRAEPESRRTDHRHRLVQQEPRYAVRNEPGPVPLSPVRRARQQPRHVYVHPEGKPVDGEPPLARLVPVGVARRASAREQRRANLRDAGDRSDQSQRASIDLPLERNPRPVAGCRARSGGQGRHHLQLHLHELLAGRDGVERLVAQRGRPADRGRERQRRGTNRSATSRPRSRHGAAQRRRPFDRLRAGGFASAGRHHTADGVSAPLDGRPLDARRHRRLRTDRHNGAARYCRRSARGAAGADLRGQPPDDRKRPKRRPRRDCDSGRGAARSA